MRCNLMSATKLVCFHCQKEVPLLGLVGRRDECPFCRADMHACKNCQHYDRASYNECKEPQAERVLEKDRSNYCDHFTPGAGLSASDDKEKALTAAEALFTFKK